MKRKYLLLSAILFFYWLCSSSFLRSNPGLPVRYISDEADRLDFFNRGLWLPEGKVPYRDTFSEYPQISTYLFGIVHLPFLGETDTIITYGKYSLLFSLLMVYILLALIVLLDKEQPDERKNLVILLLLPAPLYFTYNRFDILPAFLTMLALILIRQEKWEYAGCLLGIGALTKWYPALLVAPVVVYMYHKKELWGKILKFVLVFGLTCVVILLPTFFSGGIRAILVPYVNLQNNRGYDPDSFLGLILPIAQVYLPNASQEAIRTVFLLMQFSAIPFLLLLRINSLEKLLNCCLIAISIFMLFAPLYSPQWLLWIFPLMILVARTKWDIALIVAYGVFTYIEFPLIFDYFGAESIQMYFMGWVNILLLMLITLQAIGRFGALWGTRLVQPE